MRILSLHYYLLSSGKSIDITLQSQCFYPAISMKLSPDISAFRRIVAVFFHKILPFLYGKHKQILRF